MCYLTWEIESTLRNIAGVLRDKIDRNAYRQYGASVFSLMLLKRLSDLVDEMMGDQEPLLPSTHGVVVPVAARWSTLVASRSPNMALEIAARHIRETNTAGSPGDSLGGTISVLGTRRAGPADTERQMRRLINLVDNIELGDRSLKRQEVGPGHHMYDAYQHLVTPVNEAKSIFMEHLRIMSPLPNQPLWRYICFCRFKDLVETEEMYFRRADRLDDKYEGLPPGLDRIVGPVGLRREFTFVNCWFQGNSESDAMWRLYGTEHQKMGPEHNNLAIQTNHGALQNSLKGPSSTYIGRIKYLDYDKYIQSVGWRPLWDGELGALSLYCMKRREFSTENEVRAVIQYPIPDCINPQPPERDGVRVPTDLVGLINRVIVNPDADEKFIETIKPVLHTKALHVAVDRSKLARRPTIGQTRPTLVAFSQGDTDP